MFFEDRSVVGERGPLGSRGRGGFRFYSVLCTRGGRGSMHGGQDGVMCGTVSGCTHAPDVRALESPMFILWCLDTLDCPECSTPWAQSLGTRSDSALYLLQAGGAGLVEGP
jgi:hypothetical protein